MHLYRPSFSASEICHKNNLLFLTSVRIQFNKIVFKTSHRFKVQVVCHRMVNDALKITRFLSSFLMCAFELQQSFHSAAFELYFKLSDCGLVFGVISAHLNPISWWNFSFFFFWHRRIIEHLETFLISFYQTKFFSINQLVTWKSVITQQYKITI